MESIIEGRAYVLGDNIDTDQIIPAEHLVYSLSDPEEKKLYGKYALSGVPIKEAGLPEGSRPFVDEGKFESSYTIVIGGKNFGCGSSREHAPACLEIAGIKAVIAQSYARIFYRNAVDGGFFIPFAAMDRLVDVIKTGDSIEIDIEAGTLKHKESGNEFKLQPLGEVADIIRAGNIFEYARQSGMISG